MIADTNRVRKTERMRQEERSCFNRERKIVNSHISRFPLMF